MKMVFNNWNDGPDYIRLERIGKELKHQHLLLQQKKIEEIYKWLLWQNVADNADYMDLLERFNKGFIMGEK